jgi:hypothetical protein
MESTEIINILRLDVMGFEDVVVMNALTTWDALVLAAEQQQCRSNNI